MKPVRAPVFLLALSLAATAMATQAAGSAKAPPRPDLSRVAGTPAPPRGALYAQCLAQAASAGTFDRTSNKGTHLLRFTCSGAPAKALYEDLGAWSATHDSQWSADGRTWRATGKIVRDLFGTDYCSSDGAADFRCELTVNVGPFLDG